LGDKAYADYCRADYTRADIYNTVFDDAKKTLTDAPVPSFNDLKEAFKK
jgi:hypothetical protein